MTYVFSHYVVLLVCFYGAVLASTELVSCLILCKAIVLRTPGSGILCLDQCFIPSVYRMQRCFLWHVLALSTPHQSTPPCNSTSITSPACASKLAVFCLCMPYKNLRCVSSYICYVSLSWSLSVVVRRINVSCTCKSNILVK